MKNLCQSILILIAVLLSTTGAEEVIYAQVGQEVTLKPPGVNSQKYYLYWFFGNDNGLQLAWRNHFGGSGIIDPKDKNGLQAEANLWHPWLSLSDGSLVIKGIQQQHFGTFVCKTTVNSVTTVNGVTTVTTFKIFKFNVTMNPPSPLLSGESLSLACTTETPQSHKKPDIHWLNPQGGKMKSNQGILTMRATGQHNGQWTCVVSNNNKENKATISVTVVDLSPAPLRPQYTSLSSPLTIPCSTPISWEHIKAKGIQGVHWHYFPKPGSSLISNDPQRLFSLSLEDPLTWKPDHDRGLTAPVLKKGVPLNLSLTRKQGRQEDRGDYVCTLEFTNGVTLNRTVHVNVLEIIASPGTELISGQQVNLTCSLGHPLPSDLQLKWVPPEQLSLPSLSSDHHPAYLTIPEVRIAKNGKWSCELWHNSTRLTSADIKLKIEPKLSVWMLVIICSVAVIVILLLILVFILCRRRQRKTRHLRHKLCQCKNPKPKGFYRT